MKTAIVNVSFGSWYPNGQKRLAKSLTDNGFSGDMLLYNSEASLGAPRHQDNHYAFKAYALEQALNLGYDQILWCDSSIRIKRPLDNIFDIISNDGYLFLDNGQILGEWSSDESLSAFDISRDRAMHMPELTTCVFGLDLRRKECQKLISRLKECALAGLLHKNWNNNDGSVSSDIRVRGHRHDQTIICLLAYTFCMTNFRQGLHWYLMGNEPMPESIYFINDGGY